MARIEKHVHYQWIFPEAHGKLLIVSAIHTCNLET